MHLVFLPLLLLVLEMEFLETKLEKKPLFKKAQSFLLVIQRNISFVLHGFLSVTQLASSARRSKQKSKHHHEAFANVVQKFRNLKKNLVRKLRRLLGPQVQSVGLEFIYQFWNQCFK